ncbi:hypothetical protein VE00_07179 [Pseudogymnoascus sp. WSF 3629]|jgi:hypothetical protein|nr:hypothetical protein VE00_07179 [Pseudogymnoascus sp. WSF 3629]
MPFDDLAAQSNNLLFEVLKSWTWPSPSERALTCHVLISSCENYINHAILALILVASTKIRMIMMVVFVGQNAIVLFSTSRMLPVFVGAYSGIVGDENLRLKTKKF